MFAEVSRGKSTTINALLGEEIMRKGTGEATTKTITMLTKPVKGRDHKCVVIEYRDLEEMEIRIKKVLNEINFHPDKIDLNNDSFRQKLLKDISSKSDNVSHDVRSIFRYIKNVIDGWHNCKSHLGTEQITDIEFSDELIHDEKIAVFIRRRTIYYDNRFLNLGIDIVDTPGLGSVNERHDYETENFARNEADVALFITYPKELISKNLRDFLKDKITVDDIRKKGFFLINQVGDLKPNELKQDYGDHDGLKDKLRHMLNNELELNLEHDRIETCDALCALHAKIIVEKQKAGPLSKVDREIWDEQAMTDKKAELPSPQKNLDASRFPVLENSLEIFLKKTKIFNTIYPKYKQLKEYASLFVESIKEQKEGSKTEVKDLELKLRRLNRVREDIKSRLKNYFKKDLAEKIDKKITVPAKERHKKIVDELKNELRNHTDIVFESPKDPGSKSTDAAEKLKNAINDAISSMDQIVTHEKLEQEKKDIINEAKKGMKEIIEKFHSPKQCPDFDDLKENTDNAIVILKKLQKSVDESMFKVKEFSLGNISPDEKVAPNVSLTPLIDIVKQLEEFNITFGFEEADKTMDFIFKKLGIDNKVRELNSFLQETYKIIRTTDMVEDINEIIKKQGEGVIKETIIIGFIKEFKYSRSHFREIAKNADKLNTGFLEGAWFYLKALGKKEKMDNYKKESITEKFDREIKDKLLNNLESLTKKLNEELEKSIEENIEEELKNIEENINSSLDMKANKNSEIKAYEKMVDQYDHDAEKAIELLNEIEMEVNDLSSNPTTAIG